MNIKLHEIPECSGVYIIKCLPNKRIYIGSTENLHSRCKTHERQLKNENHIVKKLNEDIKKYGLDNIELEVLCTCDCEISTIVERYYIKKYNAIRLGYNSINASKNVKEQKTTYNTQNEYGEAEYQINLIMKRLMLDIFDYEESLVSYYISIQKLIDIYEKDYGSEFTSRKLHYLFEVFRKLDITIFIQDYKTKYFYEVSGNQMWNYIRWNTFESDNTIDDNVKNRLCGSILDFNNMYLECPKYKNNRDIIWDIKSFKKKNIVIDATYKQQYKKQGEKYTQFFLDR